MTVEKQKEELIMKSTYETMGGKYQQNGDYLLMYIFTSIIKTLLTLGVTR